MSRPMISCSRDPGDVSAAHDPLREAFDDGGLPDARPPIRTGLFFVRARQHLNHTADLVVAPDDGIELALLRERGQIAA